MGPARLNGDRRTWGELGCGRAAVLIALLGLSAAAGAQSAVPAAVRGDDLPDAPSVQMQDAAAGGDADGQKAGEAGEAGLRRCKDSDRSASLGGKDMPLQGPPPCMAENPISPIVTSMYVPPLTSEQKGRLAIRVFVDPFNFATVAAYSGIAVAANSHTAYGPGFEGWAKLTGYGLVEGAQADFFGVYAIPSLTHEDPRYHRMPTGSVKRRLWHALEHTVVGRSDDGERMPNYALLTYPISAELSNLYVPGIRTNAPSTAKRVAIGIATDPVPQIVAEFLPDVAKHIHIHAEFAQELIDRAAGVNPAMTQ